MCVCMCLCVSVSVSVCVCGEREIIEEEERDFRDFVLVLFTYYLPFFLVVIYGQDAILEVSPCLPNCSIDSLVLSSSKWAMFSVAS